MDRRTFLKTSTAAAAATTATAGAAQAQVAVQAPAITTSRSELRIAVPATPHLADAAYALAHDIGTASGGRIVLHLTAHLPQAATSIAGGDLDGAFGHVTEICAAPELALFTGLPGDMALSPDHLLTWHTAAAGAMFLNEAAGRYGLTAIITGHSGAATGLWSNREIAGIDDFAAADIQTTGLGHAVVTAIRDANGHSTANAASASLIESTASPLRAAMDVSPANRRVWYREGTHNQGFATALTFSQNAWAKLLPADRLLIETIARAATYDALAAIKASDRLVAPSVFASLNTIRKPLPEDVGATIRHTAIQITHDAMAQNPHMAPAFQAYAAFFNAFTGGPLPKPANRPSNAVS